MIDTEVERQYADTTNLLKLWGAFHEYFNLANKSPENITPEREQQFLEVKSRIAMCHDGFVDAVKRDQGVAQDVLAVVNRSITLKHVSRLSTPDSKKMEAEWHEAYLLMNDTIGELEDRRNELAGINEAQFRAKQAAQAAQQKMISFFTSTGFKLTAFLAVLLFSTVGVQSLGIYDFNELGKIGALKQPFKFGKAIVHLFDADNPYPTVDYMSRGNQTPAGYKDIKPEGKGKSEFTAWAGGNAGPLLDKATDFKTETSQGGGLSNPDVYLGTFFFPKTADAKAVAEAWEKQGKKGNGVGHTRVVRYVNLVAVIHSENVTAADEFKSKMYGDNS